MYVCMFVCMYVCMSNFLKDIKLRKNFIKQIFVFCMYEYVCVSMYVCVSVYACMYVCMYVYVVCPLT